MHRSISVPLSSSIRNVRWFDIFCIALWSVIPYKFLGLCDILSLGDCSFLSAKVFHISYSLPFEWWVLLIEPSCPPGTTRHVPWEIFPQKCSYHCGIPASPKLSILHKPARWRVVNAPGISQSYFNVVRAMHKSLWLLLCASRSHDFTWPIFLVLLIGLSQRGDYSV